MCCCLPLGIVGIVFAAKADEHYSAGRYAEAYASARNAKNWTLVGLACGVVYIVFLIAFYLLTTVATLLPLGLYWDLF